MPTICLREWPKCLTLARICSAEALPVPITDDIAKSFPGYKIKATTMFVTEDVTTYEVVIAKGSKTKTLVYEVYESMEAAQAAGFGSFIVKKR